MCTIFTSYRYQQEISGRSRRWGMRDTGPVNTNRYNNCRNVGAMREADAAVTEESIIVVTATHDKIYKAATVAVALLLLVGAAAA
jgi:hypothetical protein